MDFHLLYNFVVFRITLSFELQQGKTQYDNHYRITPKHWIIALENLNSFNLRLMWDIQTRDVLESARNKNSSNTGSS